MKNFVKWLGIFALVALIGFTMAACANPAGGGPTYGDGKTSTGHDLIVMDTVVIDSKLKNLDSETGTLVFNNLEEEEMPAIGDIICSEPSEAAEYGFFYKVKKVTTNGGETVITTEAATIEEAVPNVKASGSFELELDEDQDEEEEGVTIEWPDDDPNSRAAGNKSLSYTAPKINIEKIIEGVKLDGFIEFSIKANCEVQTGDGVLEYFELSIQPGLKAELSASISHKIEKEKTFDIKTFKLKKIKFFVGFLPVVIVPKITITVTVSAEGEVTLSAKLVELDYSYRLGVWYPDPNTGGLGPFCKDESQPIKYLQSIDLDISGEVKVKPKATLWFGLWGMAYAGVSVGPFAKLAGEAHGSINIAEPSVEANMHLALSCGLDLDAEAKLEVLGKTIAEMDSYTFKTFEWPPIWEWPSNNPVTGVTLSPASATLAVGDTRTLNFTVEPNNATNKNVTWSSSNNSVAYVTSNGTVRAENVGTTTITVTTVDGGKTATCNITVNPALPGTEANPIPLTEDIWTTGSIESGGPSTIWYSFNVTMGTPYYIWWNDYQGDGTHTLDMVASAEYRYGTSSIFSDRDSAYDTPQTFTVTQHENGTNTVKIKVSPFQYGSGQNRTGTFAIVYSRSNTRPGLAMAVPGVPVNLRVTYVSSTIISIEWDAVPGADGYYLYNVNPNNPAQQQKMDIKIYTLGANALDLTPNSTYMFMVSAFNKLGEGSQSLPVTERTSP